MNARRVRLALCLLALAMPAPLYAATCTVSANAVAFGPYDPTGLLPRDGAGNIQVSCSDVLVALSYTLRLDAGAGGGYAPRRLASGAYGLNYNLYSDPARTLVWGDGAGGTVTVTGVFAVAGTANHAVYGRLFAAQNVPAGSYADNITVTLDY